MRRRGLNSTARHLIPSATPRLSAALWIRARSCPARPCPPPWPAASTCRGRRAAGAPAAGIAPRLGFAGKARVTEAPAAMVVSGSPIASAGRAGHPARRAATRWTRRWRWASPGGGAPRGGQPRRRRLHGHPPGRRHGAARSTTGRPRRPRAPATCISTRAASPPTGASPGISSAGVPGAVAGPDRGAPDRYGQAAVRGGHRARHPAWRATDSWWTSTGAESIARGQRAAGAVPGLARHLPARTARPPAAGHAAAAARAGRHARGDPRPRRGRLLPRARWRT